MSVWVDEEPVTIVPVPGRWYSASSLIAPVPADLEQTRLILDRLQPTPFIPGDSRFAILPTMPASPPTFNPDSPIVSGAPLKAAPGPISANGFRSGSRSAIIRAKLCPASDWVIATTADGEKLTPAADGPIVLRLKGCGMYLDTSPIPFPGITLRDTSSNFQTSDQTVVDVRGVSFSQTSATEQFVLNRLSPLFHELGVELGNRPLGFWKYESLEGDPAPLIDKYVSVMTTRGDLRLEAHLLSGLAVLVTTIDNLAGNVNSVSEVYKVFPGSDDASRSFSKITKVRAFGIKQAILANLHTLNALSVPEMATSNLQSVGFVPTSDILSRLTGKCQTFVKLFAQIGWECGRCISAIHRSGFLWGTYSDHDQSHLHCNAHPDNFIVLRGEGSQLLAPVDFDMAFAKDQAVSIWAEPPGPDEDMVTWNFSAEFTSLIQDITGLTACIGGTSDQPTLRPQPGGDAGKLLWVARDAVVWEYVRGYLEPLVDRREVIGLSASDAAEMIEEALNYTKGVHA
jgi:hypothetical protein